MVFSDSGAGGCSHNSIIKATALQKQQTRINANLNLNCKIPDRCLCLAQIVVVD